MLPFAACSASSCRLGATSALQRRSGLCSGTSCRCFADRSAVPATVAATGCCSPQPAGSSRDRLGEPSRSPPRRSFDGTASSSAASGRFVAAANRDGPRSGRYPPARPSPGPREPPVGMPPHPGRAPRVLRDRGGKQAGAVGEIDAEPRLGVGGPAGEEPPARAPRRACSPVPDPGSGRQAHGPLRRGVSGRRGPGSSGRPSGPRRRTPTRSAGCGPCGRSAWTTC